MTPRSINRFIGVAGILIALYGLTNCSPSPEKVAPKAGTVEFKIAEIGDAAVAAHYPKYDRKRFPIRIMQEGDRWIFDYQLPENSLGGTPTVEIDRRTFKILKIYHSQ